MPPRLRAVFFDLGETLVTQNIEDNMVTKRALQEIARMIPRAERHENLYAIYKRAYKINQRLRLKHQVEIPIQTWMTQLLRRALRRDPDERLVQRAVVVVARHRGANAVAFKDAKPVVESLTKRDVKLGIISNISSHEVALQILKHVRLQGYFDRVVTSALVGVRKPDPGIFRYALFQLGLNPEQAVHVGDSEQMDVCGAKAIGLKTILVSRRGSKPATIADYCAGRLNDVADLVQELEKDR
ncbi:MAG: hypothetical protein AUJ07_05520 [Crenarchaeota archaeon 13_1_40CM_3_53_5]|nr:MAG: hypothetical protein AUJ07_05520 [Crenarchaeota archaeon 13_1_40CM_3_53_5]